MKMRIPERLIDAVNTVNHCHYGKTTYEKNKLQEINAIPAFAQRAGSSLVALIHNNERLPTSLRKVLALRR